MPQDNYALLADRTRLLFLTYDQSAMLRHIPLTADTECLYLPVLDRTCRICRTTGHLFWSSPGGSWEPSTLPSDAISIFDYLCDAKPDRALTGTYRPLSGFGHMFHTSLTESTRPSLLEQYIDTHPEHFRAACTVLGGIPYPRGDIGFTVPLFPDFPVLLQFWHSDEDFSPQLRPFWDSASLSWLRYETMYYAWDLILNRLKFIMDFPE